MEDIILYNSSGQKIPQDEIQKIKEQHKQREYTNKISRIHKILSQMIDLGLIKEEHKLDQMLILHDCPTDKFSELEESVSKQYKEKIEKENFYNWLSKLDTETRIPITPQKDKYTRAKNAIETLVKRGNYKLKSGSQKVYKTQLVSQLLEEDLVKIEEKAKLIESLYLDNLPIADETREIDNQIYLATAKLLKYITGDKINTKLEANYSKPAPLKSHKIKDNNELMEDILNNPDFDIRLKAVERLSAEHLPNFINDLDFKVRSEVASRIDKKYLPQMIKDPAPVVRYYATKRINKKYLPKLMKDTDVGIRRIVAKRINVNYLSKMTKDKDVDVRKEIVARINPCEGLDEFILDDDFGIRKIVAGRIHISYLPDLIRYNAVTLNNSNQKINQQYIILDIALERIKNDDYLLRSLKNNKSGYVRDFVARHASKNTLKSMANDEDLFIRDVVNRRLGIFNWIFWAIKSLTTWLFLSIFRIPNKIYLYFRPKKINRLEQNYEPEMLKEAEKELEEFLGPPG